MLMITINPRFRLYLDESGKVLALEAVNVDASSLLEDIPFENQGYETVVQSIVTAANQNGFVKEDATIDLEIVESRETEEARAEILGKKQRGSSQPPLRCRFTAN